VVVVVVDVETVVMEVVDVTLVAVVFV